MAKKPKAPVAAEPAPLSLEDQLHGPVEAPDLDWRQIARLAEHQRDDALKTLNRRANIDLLLRQHDQALAKLEQTMDQLLRLERQLGDRIDQLTRGLRPSEEEEDA